jgi:hypothetical protein
MGAPQKSENTGRRVAAPTGEKSLVRNQPCEDDGGERHTFDQCRGQQHVGGDSTAGFRLAGDAFDRLAADATDAEPGADHGQTHSDARAGYAKSMANISGLREDCYHVRHSKISSRAIKARILAASIGRGCFADVVGGPGVGKKPRGIVRKFSVSFNVPARPR